jgi:hypothetical protein
MDIITHLCFGKPFGFVDSDDDVYDFLSTVENMVPIVHQFSVILELNTILLRIMNVPCLKKLIAPSTTDKSGIGKVLGVGLCPFLLFNARELTGT